MEQSSDVESRTDAAERHWFSADDEREALGRAKAGDLAALEPLWRATRPAALRYARAISGSFDPEDVVSEATARVIQAIRNGNGPERHFRQYFRAAVKSTIVSWARLPIEANQDEVFWDEIEAVPVGLLWEEGEDIRRAMAALPPQVRELLWRVEVLGESAGEISARSGKSLGATYVALYRARRDLRTSWDRLAGDVDPSQGNGAERAS